MSGRYQWVVDLANTLERDGRVSLAVAIEATSDPNRLDAAWRVVFDDAAAPSALYIAQKLGAGRAVVGAAARAAAVVLDQNRTATRSYRDAIGTLRVIEGWARGTKSEGSYRVAYDRLVDLAESLEGDQPSRALGAVFSANFLVEEDYRPYSDDVFTSLYDADAEEYDRARGALLRSLHTLVPSLASMIVAAAVPSRRNPVRRKRQ